MINLLKRLWADESGAIISSEMVLVTSILTVGMVTGLTSVRDALMNQLADISYALNSLDQSYSISPTIGPFSSTAGSRFIDVHAKNFQSNVDRTDFQAWNSQNKCIVVGSNLY